MQRTYEFDTFWISSEEGNVVRQVVGIEAESANDARRIFSQKYPARQIRSVRTDRRDETGRS